MDYLTSLPKDIQNLVDEHLETRLSIKTDKTLITFTITTDAFEYTCNIDNTDRNMDGFKQLLDHVAKKKTNPVYIAQPSGTLYISSDTDIEFLPLMSPFEISLSIGLANKFEQMLSDFVIGNVGTRKFESSRSKVIVRRVDAALTIITKDALIRILHRFDKGEIKQFITRRTRLHLSESCYFEWLNYDLVFVVNRDNRIQFYGNMAKLIIKQLKKNNTI